MGRRGIASAMLPEITVAGNKLQVVQRMSKDELRRRMVESLGMTNAPKGDMKVVEDGDGYVAHFEFDRSTGDGHMEFPDGSRIALTGTPGPTPRGVPDFEPIRVDHGYDAPASVPVKRDGGTTGTARV